MTKTLLAIVVAVIALSASRGAAAQEAHAPVATRPGHAADGSGADHAKAGPDAHGKAGTDHADDAAHQAGGAHAASHGAAGATHGGDHDAGPVVPQDRKAVWPGVLLILILTMFALAAVIGPIARMHAPPAEMPVTHSHDEPPGASHHHGSSGTINPEPDHHGGSAGHGHGHH